MYIIRTTNHENARNWNIDLVKIWGDGSHWRPTTPNSGGHVPPPARPCVLRPWQLVGFTNELWLGTYNLTIHVLLTRACERSVSGKKSRSTLKAFLEPPLSAPFPLRNPPLRAPLTLHRFLWPSAHRSVPAHPIFGPLRSVFRSAHAQAPPPQMEN